MKNSTLRHGAAAVAEKQKKSQTLKQQQEEEKKFHSLKVQTVKIARKSIWQQQPSKFEKMSFVYLHRRGLCSSSRCLISTRKGENFFVREKK